MRSILFLILILAACATPPEIYQSGVPASVAPEVVKGDIVFRIFPGEHPENKRIHTCYLQHGYGVPSILAQASAAKYDRFVRAYYGDQLIPALLASACGQVILAVQESNETNILEMTIRTERFLRDTVCSADHPGQVACAYIGHSKGGAVAYNVARRCMQRTSEMGEKSCGRLGEIFSAAGVVQGAMLTFTALGAYVEQKSDAQSFLSAVLGFGMNLVWDVYQEYIPGKTNPIWVDLSPFAPMENGSPLYLVNSVPLQKSGWLKADFAAAASDFEYKGDGKDDLSGCGDESSIYSTGCKKFGAASEVLHRNELKPAFEKGRAAIVNDIRFAQLRGILEAMTWEKQQRSDGLADFELAMNSCRAGLLVTIRPAVKRCATIHNLNHWAAAGGGPEIRNVMIEELSN
ncbi:MAG: hypothetical protein K8S54_01575 [Spirochaetia bacterium]|nr:hypothetical protein [Spirochaetia bacterium]